MQNEEKRGKQFLSRKNWSIGNKDDKETGKSEKKLETRVARWYIFIPKIKIRVNLVGLSLELLVYPLGVFFGIFLVFLYIFHIL
jgi:hypothetical protein